MRYFKVLNVDGRSTGSQQFPWSLPEGQAPGQWLPTVEGEIVVYVNGYHICTVSQLIPWLGPRIWEVEARGELLDTGKMTVVRSARIIAPTCWDDRTARLFACDCAARALRRERKAGREPDKRSWKAINVARRYAEGKATKAELTVARTAAGDVWDAARANVSATDWTTDKIDFWTATRTAWDITDDDASVAVRDATDAATGYNRDAAAGDVERRWQARRLQEYLLGKPGEE